jgi:hypothetical protein
VCIHTRRRARDVLSEEGVTGSTGYYQRLWHEKKSHMSRSEMMLNWDMGFMWTRRKTSQKLK